MKAVFVLGPTASGKSAVALALARRFPAEIVSVDSAAVYRGLDIGTAKPDAAERAAAPHHLIDIVDPTEAYSAGRFRDDALRLVGEIHARGRLPILAGGTMLYFSALTRGLADLPRADARLRAAIEERAAKEGWPALHAELARVDPASAARIEPTDSQRIQRALEVHALAGEPLSALQARRDPVRLPFTPLRLALEPSDRAVLHERIARRFHAMLDAGLVEEVAALRARHALHEALPAMRAVGYRQAWQTLAGDAPRETLADRGIAATRQLAKRQLTWLRAMAQPGHDAFAPPERFDCLEPALAERIVARVARFVDQSSSP
ncbi:MAG TPA: tRNA (adenosine(37)-N6)-dimethylallyltransferase MiaA [Usitatibacter sp.]|nr:tRNA (adenosine(37)-N6)-dimethylallyltransferase MiaA [Usitatibacter sp.]